MDEKVSSYENGPGSDQETRRRTLRSRFWRRILGGAILATWVYNTWVWYITLTPEWAPCILEGEDLNSLPVGYTPSTSVWDQIESSEQFKFTPCFDGFECARLQVPLDWNSTDDPLKAKLAVIKKPALVDVTDPRYGGPILLNPGGPGGSGVNFALRVADALQLIVDTGPEEGVSTEALSNERYFDIISWDPRGINNTTPTVPGITDPGVHREYLQRMKDFGYSIDNEESFGKIFDLYQLYGRLISAPDNGDLGEGKHVGNFVGTAYVARDMVEIVERHGEWRAHKAKEILRNRCGTDAYCLRSLDDNNADDSPFGSILERTAWRKDSEKIQYWGFSYGTILGQTFASMYPERIGRFVLDGVANVANYYAGDWGKTSFNSAEAINANFTATCAEAGPSLCPMANWTSSSSSSSISENTPADNLLASLYSHLNALKTSPVTALYDASQSPTIVTWSDTMRALFQLYYNGWAGYRIASRMLYELSQGNPRWFHLTSSSPFTCPSPSAPGPKDAEAAAMSIICTDASPKTSYSKQDWKSFVADLKTISPTFFGYGASVAIPCTGYTQRPKWRYAEPIGAPAARLGNPILFVSQTLDPICPLVSAEGAAKLFEGSGLVEAQGVGHCSFGWPNVCAALAIRRYLATGEVSGERVVCPGSVGPFETEQEVRQRMRGMPEGKGGERRVMETLVEVGRDWPMMDTGGY